MSRVDELIALLPWGLAQEPGARAFLEGLLAPVGQVEGFLDVKASATLDLADPFEIPDELVEHLAATVGVGRDFPPAFSLTTDEQRRLIAVAVALWKRKGTRVTWRQVLLYLAGARALIIDWFEHRIANGDTLELHVLPDPYPTISGWAAGDTWYEVPAYTTDVWYADPLGTVNLAAVVRWLDALRPGNERINLIPALFIEDLQLGTEQWAIQAPAKPGNGRVTLLDGTAAIRSTEGNAFGIDPAVPLGSSAGGADLFVLLRTTGNSWIFLWDQGTEGADCYALKIEDGVRVRGYRVVAGTPIQDLGVALALPQTLTDGFPYRWRISIGTNASNVAIRVTWEGVYLGAFTNASKTYSDGRFGFAAGALSTDAAELQQLLVYAHTPTVTRVGPNP